MTMTLVAFGIASVYLFCLVVGLAFAILSLVLGGLGGHGGFDGGGHDIAGHDFGGHDYGGHDTGGHGGAGHGSGQAGDAGGSAVHFSPLSPVVIAIFVTGFGAVGLIVESGLHGAWFVSLPLASLAGFAVAAATFFVFAKLVAWAQGSSEASVTEAVGAAAEVLTPIPAGGIGEIAYCLRDRRFTAPARGINGQGIAGHAQVVIVEVSGSTFVVRETQEEELRKLTMGGGGGG